MSFELSEKRTALGRVIQEARSIGGKVREAQRRDLALQKALDFQAIPGKGIGAQIDGRAVLLGNRALMD